MKEKTGNNGGKTQRIFRRLKEFGESNTWLKIRMFLKVLTIVLVFMLLTVLTVQWFSLRISSSGTVQSKIGKVSSTLFTSVK